MSILCNNSEITNRIHSISFAGDKKENSLSSARSFPALRFAMESIRFSIFSNCIFLLCFRSPLHSSTVSSCTTSTSSSSFMLLFVQISSSNAEGFFNSRTASSTFTGIVCHFIAKESNRKGAAIRSDEYSRRDWRITAGSLRPRRRLRRNRVCLSIEGLLGKEFILFSNCASRSVGQD